MSASLIHAESNRPVRITVCGAGALGGSLASVLARSGFEDLTVIDRARIEDRHLGHDPYGYGDVGLFKTKILSTMIRRAVGVEVEPISWELDTRNIATFVDADLVVDTFDNIASREIVQSFCDEQGIACLHVAADSDQSVASWNDVPDLEDAPASTMSAGAIAMTVGVASEVVKSFVDTTRRQAFSIQFADLLVRIH